MSSTVNNERFGEDVNSQNNCGSELVWWLDAVPV